MTAIPVLPPSPDGYEIVPEVIGLQRALRVFQEIEHMGRQSVDGQAMELEWVKRRTWNLTDRHYHIMTTSLKTGPRRLVIFNVI